MRGNMPSTNIDMFPYRGVFITTTMDWDIWDKQYFIESMKRKLRDLKVAEIKSYLTFKKKISDETFFRHFPHGALLLFYENVLAPRATFNASL